MRLTKHGETVYEIQDLAKAIGMSYPTTYARIYGGETIPKPSVTIGRRQFFSAKMYAEILRLFNVEKQVSA